MNVKRLQAMQQIIDFLHDALKAKAENCFVLHGRLSKRQRAMEISELESLDDPAPRIKYAKRAHISERKFPQLVRLFAAGLEASHSGPLSIF